MKRFFSLFASLLIGIILFAQEYSFSKNFVDGTVIFNDNSQKGGQLKWFPTQNEKLRFKETNSGDMKKYSPEDILGFAVDTLRFSSLFNFEVCAEQYPLLGKMTKIKHSFGQLVDSGKFNIYLVFISGYDALSGSIQTYPNFLFQKKADSVYQYAAFPYTVRMRDKPYEKAKDGLYEFFKDYPAIVEKIKTYKQQDDFYNIIRLMETSN